MLRETFVEYGQHWHSRFGMSSFGHMLCLFLTIVHFLPPPSPQHQHVRPDLGGAYGTAMAGKGIMAMGVRSPELLMKNIIPVVMAGVLGIYGLM